MATRSLTPKKAGQETPADATVAVKRAAVFHWDATKEQALWLVFDGKLSLEQVALNVAVSPRTLDRWVAHPAFQQRLQQMRADLQETLKGTLYVSKESRMVALADMAQKARREFEKRPWLKEVRPTKDGPVTNESFNRDAFESFRGALDDIAKELGQRKNVTEVTGKDGGPIELSAVKQQLAAQLADRARRQRALPAPGEPE